MTNRALTEVYEQIEGYLTPPLPPTVDVDDFEAPDAFGPISVRITKKNLAILRAASRLSGFTRFQREFAINQDRIMRTTWARRNPRSMLEAVTFGIADDPRPLSMSERAATIVFGAYGFHRELRRRSMPQDTRRDKPLEMGQYANFFGTCVRNDGDAATLHKSNCIDVWNVLCRGNVYSLTIDAEAILEGETGSSGAVFEKLVATFDAIVAHAREAGTDRASRFPGGLLCGADPKLQSATVKSMSKRPTNVTSAARLRESFSTICLDLDASPQSPAEAMRLGQVGAIDNRWYSASIQFVVFANSRAAMLANFSTYLDGNVMARGGAEVFGRASRVHVTPRSAQKASPFAFERLEWDISEQGLERLRASASQLIHPDPAWTFELPIGRGTFGSRDVSASFTVAVHLASSKLTGRPCRVAQHTALSMFRYMGVQLANMTTPELERLMADPTSTTLRDEAVQSASRAVRAPRRLHMETLLGLDLCGRTRVDFARAMAVWMGAYLSMRGDVAFPDIVISAPVMNEFALMLGRPGVAHPQLPIHALHYDIGTDSTRITMMRGKHSGTSNAQFADELQRQLTALAAA